jgi:hypothetical protein
VDKRRSVQVNIDFVAARTPLVVPFGKQDFLFFVSVEVSSSPCLFRGP